MDNEITFIEKLGTCNINKVGEYFLMQSILKVKMILKAPLIDDGEELVLCQKQTQCCQC